MAITKILDLNDSLEIVHDDKTPDWPSKDGSRVEATPDNLSVVVTDNQGKRYKALIADLLDPLPGGGDTATDIARVIVGYLTNTVKLDGDASNLAREGGGHLAIIAAALESPNIGAASTVAANTSSVLLLAASAERAPSPMRNASSQTLFLGYGHDATLTSAIAIPPSGIWIADFIGVINGIWAVADGSVLIEEKTRS